jgi:hypothetical protein
MSEENKPEINVKYIRKVLRFIENGPKLRFDMGTYINRVDPKENTKLELREMEYPPLRDQGVFCRVGSSIAIEEEPVE